MSENKKHLFTTWEVVSHKNKTPVIKRRRDLPWINADTDNGLFDYYLRLYNESGTHRAIVDGKVHYIFGKGLKVNTQNPELKKQVEALLKRANKKESYNTIARKCVNDLEIYNGYALRIVSNPFTGKEIARWHIPFNQLRTNEHKSRFYHSKEWTKEQAIDINYAGGTRKPKDLKEFEPYGTPGAIETIFYYTCYTADEKVYPMPIYSGAKSSIETEIEIHNFNRTNIKTGFAAGTILTFTNGVPTEDEQRELEQQIKRKVSGTDNAGEIILYFTDGKDNIPDVQRVQPDEMADQYTNLENSVRQDIFTSHQVTSPMLFGQKTEGQLGGSSEMSEAYEIFYSNYGKPRGEHTLTKIETFIKNQLPGEYTLEYEQNPPISKDYFDTIMPEIIKTLPAELLRKEAAKRLGIDLTEYDNAQFSSQDIFARFENIGEPAEDYDFICYKSITKEVGENLDQWEKRMLSLTMRQRFDDRGGEQLTSNEQTVLDIVLDGEETALSVIAKKLGVSEDEAARILNRLMAKNLIAYTTVDKAGRPYIKPEIPEPPKDYSPDTQVVIKYRYFGPYDNKNRDFCRKMLDAGKVYDRSDIEKLNNGMDMSVWDTRGGWYTDPVTGNTRDNCRHIWQLTIARKRGAA